MDQKKFNLLMVLSLCISLLFTLSAFAQQQEVPSYAKWGNIAVKETIKKYPDASVIDYLHIGREEKEGGIAIEKFKLWLRKDKKEFGVFVNVEFEVENEKFISISFEETDR